MLLVFNSPTIRLLSAYKSFEKSSSKNNLTLKQYLQRHLHTFTSPTIKFLSVYLSFQKNSKKDDWCIDDNLQEAETYYNNLHIFTSPTIQFLSVYLEYQKLSPFFTNLTFNRYIQHLVCIDWW